ncbi:MAG: bifunctional DNA primase/polymerase, partial [Kangiellaceae bacterium]
MNFSNYFKEGFSVVACRGKLPLIQWKHFQENFPDEEQLKEWDDGPHNVAIITGKLSGLVVIDIDGDYPPDWPEMPPTWCVKTSSGWHYYFKYPDFHIGNRAGIAPKVDVRGEGGYVVAPPSVHPETGVIYKWECKEKLYDLPDWLSDILRPQDKPSQSVPTVQVDYQDSYIQAAVQDEILTLSSTGEGQRNHQLNTSAFNLAQLISPNEVENILTPVALNIGLTAKETQKTIVSAVKSAKPREIPESKLQPPDDCLLVRTILEKKKTYSEIDPYLINEAPGMVGNLLRWILKTSLYPQPILALAASIPALGNVLAHRVCTETNLRTNFYTLGIAESGAGKEHARRCIAKLYEHTGLTDTLLGDPASATAVINSVKRAKGRGIMMIDEFGRYLESINGKNASSHTKMISTNMMYLYNAAGDIFTGQEYANNNAVGGRSDIDQPCLGIYATTVPSRFYNSLSNEDAFDGFLSRWLMFETKRFDVEPTLGRTLEDPPDLLCDEINQWTAHATYHGTPGSIGGYTTIKPRVISFTNTARRDYHNYIMDCRKRMAQSNELVERAFWNRAAEHAAKLSLLVHTGMHIDDVSFEWAKTLATSLTQAIIDNVQSNITQNSYEDDLKK